MHPLFRHWRLLGAGFLLVAFSAVGQTFVLSLFGGEWRAAFGLSHGGLGGLYSAATLASALLLVAAGHLVDRLALRLMVAMVVLGAALGSSVIALSTGLLGLVLGLFLLRFFGQGLMTHTAQTAVARAFRSHRGKAVSLVAAGFPMAEAVAPLLVVGATAALGWRTAWGLAAGLLIVLALLLLALLGRDRRHRDAAAAEPGAEAQWTRGQVLRDPRFYLILPALMGAPFLVTAVFFHQVPLAEAEGWSLEWLAASFPAFAAGHLTALSVSGALIDRLGARRLLPWHLTPLLLALITLAAASGAWVAPVYLGLAGLGMGLANPLMGVIWVELYGTAHLGAIRSVAQAAMILATAAAPVSVGVLLDLGWSMETIAGLLAGYALLGSLLAGAGLRR